MSNLHKLYDYFSNDGNERCGVILKSGEVVELKNIHPSPKDNFEVSPDALVELESDVAMTWHTHPRASVNLSLVDYVTFLAYSEWDHVIVAQKHVRVYGMQNDHLVIKEQYDASSY